MSRSRTRWFTVLMVGMTLGVTLLLISVALPRQTDAPAAPESGEEIRCDGEVGVCPRHPG